MRPVNLEYILAHKNANDEVYSCDIDRFLGVKLDYATRRQLQIKFTEIQDKYK